MKNYTTTAAYLSGAICGPIWQPGFDNCGIPYRDDLRRRFARFNDPRGATFRDALLSALMNDGGDFQNPLFSSDTVLRVERRSRCEGGRYTVHIWERRISELPDCADLVRPDTFASDYFGEG